MRSFEGTREQLMHHSRISHRRAMCYLPRCSISRHAFFLPPLASIHRMLLRQYDAVLKTAVEAILLAAVSLLV
jgi:hypothetical protein